MIFNQSKILVTNNIQNFAYIICQYEIYECFYTPINKTYNMHNLANVYISIEIIVLYAITNIARIYMEKSAYMHKRKKALH